MFSSEFSMYVHCCWKIWKTLCDVIGILLVLAQNVATKLPVKLKPMRHAYQYRSCTFSSVHVYPVYPLDAVYVGKHARERNTPCFYIQVACNVSKRNRDSTGAMNDTYSIPKVQLERLHKQEGSMEWFDQPTRYRNRMLGI